MDQSHELTAITLSDLQSVLRVADEFNPNEVVPLQPSSEDSQDTIELPSWLRDERSREQYAVVQGNNAIDVFWFDSVVGSEANYAREHWTDSRSSWSPRGTFLATYHFQGIVLWGGPSWDKIKRFPHPNVQFAQFSNQEKYLVTWNGMETMPGEENNDSKCIIVWDVATGRKLRAFPVPPSSESESKRDQPVWPIFKWSHDDKYFARAGEDIISVYVTPSMGLLDKKSIRIPRLQSFEWSPTDPVLAYWTPEEGDSPARLCLIEIPSRKELRQKGVYSVENVKLQWKSNGDYLACRILRFTKNKKVQYTNFELIHMRDKDYPIDILDFKEKEVVDAFEWEPKGNRFAVIHGDPPNKSDVSFYSMESTTNGQLKHLFTLEKRSFNQVFWSPAGNFCMLARLGNPNESVNGTFEWYNVSDQEMIGSGEHYCSTNVEWDPSGRHVCSYTSFNKFKTDNGYIIFNISGKQLMTVTLDKLYQFLWRPRPPLLLSAEQEKNVKKNIKKYRDRFEREDEELKESKRSGRAAERRTLRELWKSYLASREDILHQVSQKRSEMPEDEYEVIEETKEIVLNVEEEIDYNRPMLSEEDMRD
eukprot:Plantae.Rhodophyta-Purpureofilum_apyrenoidigerum.ctg22246.p1 GENE.Plantae.Rhodophyta-Purpureofilum_apyrenoidigerum.ctg22246~~Plantae.Rhodophyta-Purpureofilum_apyrenoidigerum.ctg22246.p1  ORF type:complete len:633 (-),score=145.85 Plantae.Rhodophyta-Purpureofilum_apyrenoidigerum.ctg22246:61-1830(-)